MYNLICTGFSFFKTKEKAVQRLIHTRQDDLCFLQYVPRSYHNAAVMWGVVMYRKMKKCC